jgi:hypothetical protein
VKLTRRAAILLLLSLTPAWYLGAQSGSTEARAPRAKAANPEDAAERSLLLAEEAADQADRSRDRLAELSELAAAEAASGGTRSAPRVIRRGLPIAGASLGGAASIAGGVLYAVGRFRLSESEDEADPARAEELREQWQTLSQASVLPAVSGSVLLSVSLPFLFEDPSGGDRVSGAADATTGGAASGGGSQAADTFFGPGVSLTDIEALSAYRDRLEEELLAGYRSLPRMRGLESWGIGIAAVSGSVLATSLVLGQVAFQRYNDAVFTEDAIDLRNEVDVYRYVSFGAGAALSLSVSLWQYAVSRQARVPELLRSLVRVNEAIEAIPAEQR